VNKPVYVAIGVTVNGERDILRLWAGDGGEGAKFWLSVLTEIKNRGVQDVCIVVCDGLKGLPDAVTATWELAAAQACIIHLVRNTFRYACRRDWDAWPRTCDRLHRPHRTRGGRGVRGVHRDLGRTVPGRRQALAVGAPAGVVPGHGPSEAPLTFHYGQTSTIELVGTARMGL